MKLYPTKPYFSQESIEFIVGNFREILEGKSFLTLGKYCEEFEKRFADYIGSKFAATTNSGTSALEAALTAVDVRGYDVIVPTNTFGATVFAVIRAGGRPVFADCLEDLTVDPDDVKKRLTPNTKVVITVHIGGMLSPATYELVDICRETGLLLIEDAAQAHGSALDGKKAGSFGVAGAFSFFSTKVMTTGEGGMVTTDDMEIHNKVLLIRDQAKVNNMNYHETLGYNWRLTEVQALMGITQLMHLDDFIKRRQEIAAIYNEELREFPNLELLEVPSNVHHNYYKYIAFVPHGIDREKLRSNLRKGFNVPLGGYVYEIPCHEQPAFKEYHMATLPKSEDLCRRHIAPPTYYTLRDDEARYIADSLKRGLS